MPLLAVRRERPLWYFEVPLLIAGYFLFGLIRAAVDRGDPAATDNALRVQRLERFLHIAIEYPLNQAMLDHPVAIHATGYFYRLSILAVPVVLIWLYLTRPARYGRLRTVLVVTMLLDLPFVWLYPEAPPRFALAGIVDYMATYDILFSAESRIPRPGVNLLAAMPSMHVAWTTWCGYAVWSALRERAPRLSLFAWVFPLLTALVVLVTGHHYVVDIVAGVTLVGVSIGLTTLVRKRTSA
ncbi:phosphatase PAP2 family protein [Saccharothrix violaceirubra]|uniref:Membrane-associated phospholipid phosphatase n=1 Tax=Saccharothrix violaceirubra TaxID=413306 RepID=A0A7W7SYS1_9PSEU|nr:phosphatase PAP2 family protein [Saccharothrix violaceirubra]MBB4963433.1 membrane-associated phospholipid phosphatase [Saccharothrix violaceirubra]